MDEAIKPKVELHPAHTWDCDACGKENFCRGVTLDPESDAAKELQAVHEEHGEDFCEGHWMTSPDEVTCAHCGAEFETFDQREDEDD